MPLGLPQDLEVRIRGNVSDLQKKGAQANAVFRRIERNAQQMTRRVRNIAGGFAAVSGAALAAGVGVAKLAERGGRVQGVLNGFARVTGDAEGSLKKLRAETRGLVSNFDLVTQFNQALATGAAKSVDEFGRLARTSQDLGRALGIDATDALEKFSIALARQSKLRLDDLGITLDVAKANEAFARSIGVNVKSLSDEQKAMAFRQAAFAEADRLVEGFGSSSLKAADQARRAQVQFRNLFDEVARKVNESDAVAAFFEKIADFGKQLTDIVRAGQEKMATAFKAIGGFLGTKLAQGLYEGFAAVIQANIDNNPFPGVGKVLDAVFGPAVDALRRRAEEAQEASQTYVEAFQAVADAAAEFAAGRGGGAGAGGGGSQTDPGILGERVDPGGAGRLVSIGLRSRYYTAGLDGGHPWTNPDYLAGIETFRKGLEDSVQYSIRFLPLLEEIGKELTAMQEVGVGFANSFADAMAGAAFDGIAAFKRFADQAIRELTRIAAKFLLFKFLEFAFPQSAITAAFGASIGQTVQARAYGGPVASGRPYLVGERGPELFVPGASGAIAANMRPTLNLNIDVSQLPRPADPRVAARDRDWLELIGRSVRALEAQGFSLAR